MSTSIKFICYKWGKKYPSIYVNRLYNMVKAHYNGSFSFHCITDDISNIRNEIITHDINKIASNPIDPRIYLTIAYDACISMLHRFLPRAIRK